MKAKSYNDTERLLCCNYSPHFIEFSVLNKCNDFVLKIMKSVLITMASLCLKIKQTLQRLSYNILSHMVPIYPINLGSCHYSVFNIMLQSTKFIYNNKQDARTILIIFLKKLIKDRNVQLKRHFQLKT